MRIAVPLAFALALCLTACGGGEPATAASAQDSTSGAEFVDPGKVEEFSFDESDAVTQNDGSIDISKVSSGIVMAHAQSPNRLKFVVAAGDMSYNYDLPGDDTPIACPINMGDGTYTFSIMRNVSGTSYVETASATADVTLESEFAPFCQPNLFCNYTDSSPCVQKAREVVADAQNQGDAVRAVCNYVVDNVSYDTQKAEQLSGTTGYVPSPDDTLKSGKGICFDYASLGAAMLRSVGIPTKIVTGYVSPDDLYHAWIMVYIDGSWSSAQFSVNPQSWSRVDLTFADGTESVGTTGDGKSYTDRYVY